MSLKGGPQLRARLKAIRESFKPLGRDWADETVRIMRSSVPVKTGRLRNSIRRRNATARKATVVSHFSAYFVDAGTKAHTSQPKKAKALRWDSGGIHFAKRAQIPAKRPRPFRARAATQALEKSSPLKAVLNAWNKAA